MIKEIIQLLPEKQRKRGVWVAFSVLLRAILDFAGVDIMFGKQGEPVLCEVNSNAHFKNIYDCTGVNVADEIMEYILNKV
jgi:glutathione synthase/RimK-type ligase-like ATP-grasp enzyme